MKKSESGSVSKTRYDCNMCSYETDDPEKYTDHCDRVHDVSPWLMATMTGGVV